MNECLILYIVLFKLSSILNNKKDKNLKGGERRCCRGWVKVKGKSWGERNWWVSTNVAKERRQPNPPPLKKQFFQQDMVFELQTGHQFSFF
jgi:hypothetical protein